MFSVKTCYNTLTQNIHSFLSDGLFSLLDMCLSNLLYKVKPLSFWRNVIFSGAANGATESERKIRSRVKPRAVSTSAVDDTPDARVNSFENASLMRASN